LKGLLTSSLKTGKWARR